MNELPVERTLGMQWNVELDKFQYRIIPNNKPFTRRGILSIIYDPFGFVSPVIFGAKLILQRLYRKKLGWDERIPDEELLYWKGGWQNYQFWKVLERFGVERCIKPENFGDAKKTELHHFSDASKAGYGEVTYIRQISQEGKIHCSSGISKSRLAPMKPLQCQGWNVLLLQWP